ncbi:hypothetical protein OZ666_17650 [Elizabethkingia sp. HX QKY]|uniref:hypothetical protein n=1 Tax=Elizabethkingia TaxID=308865 RepID=UPI002A23E561|nr:hypothetical protein [Elizabethkingia sp. HX QKY]MDX8573523.1 hypothetical protein [Elizabethkingia sp. HX QKY]
MTALKLISIFSYLLIFVPSENGTFTIALLFLVAVSSYKNILYGSFFNSENLINTGGLLLILGALFCLNFSKNKYLRIICYIVLFIQLAYSFYNADYSSYKVEGSNIIFVIIMPLLFVLSSYFVAFNKNIFKKKE